MDEWADRGALMLGRVLVIDDSELVLELVACDLTDAGFAVTAVEGGVAGVAAATDGVFDAVVCDLHMPELDGFETLSAIRERRDDLPVIILSSDDELDAVLTAWRRGAFDFIVKAVSHTGPLVAAVERAIGHSRLLRENRRLTAELEATQQQMQERLTTELGLATAELQRHLSELDARNQALEEEMARRIEVECALQLARDQALAASRAKSAFLANMSHELRTPLNAILGYTELIRESATPEAGEDLVDDIDKVHGAGVHLLGLINEVLDLSRIEAGEASFHAEQASLRAVVEQVVAVTRPLVQRGGNRFDVVVEEDLGSVFSDVQKIKQVLINVIGNAAKFTRDGTVVLRVARRRPDDRVVFTVEDTGIGMSQEHMKRVFEAFFQVDSSSRKRFGGTGLGLTISHRLTQLIGGELRVSSALGRGSRFEIEIPARLTPNPTDGADPIEQPGGAAATAVDCTP